MAWTNPISTPVAGQAISVSTFGSKVVDNFSYLDAMLVTGTAASSFTPTWTGLTVGNGTSSGSYLQHGKLVWFRARFVFGSTSSMTGPLLLTLPVTQKTQQPYGLFDSIFWDDSTTRPYPALALTTGLGTTLTIYAHRTATNSYAEAVTSTVPFTWTTTDEINVSGFYEAA